MNFSGSALTATLELSEASLKLETDGNSYWLNNHYAGESELVPIDTFQSLNVHLEPYGSAIYTISDVEELVEIPALNIFTDVADREVMPTENILHRIFPNPFNPSTTIRLTLSQPGLSSIRIYDLKGRTVWTGFENAYMNSGTYELEWNGVDNGGEALSTGLFFVEFETAGTRQVQKITLLR